MSNDNQSVSQPQGQDTQTVSNPTPQPLAQDPKKQEKHPNLNAGNPGNNGGRPTKYDPKFADELLDYFLKSPKNEQIIKREKIIRKSNGTEEVEREYMTVPCDLPTLDKFARKIGVNGDTLVVWASSKYKDKYDLNDKKAPPQELWGKLKRPKFSAAYNMAKILQKEFLTDNGLRGLYPPASFIFVAKNVTDYRDKVESNVDLTSKGEKIKQVVGFNYLPPAKENGSDNPNP